LKEARRFSEGSFSPEVGPQKLQKLRLVSEKKIAAGEPEFLVTGGRYGDRVTPSPARRTSTEAARELARLERVLGLSPADRVGLGLTAPSLGGEDDPMERLLADHEAVQLPRR